MRRQDAQKPTRRFDIIVVYDVKRFGRIDNDEAGYYRYLLRTHGVEVHYVSENFNGDSNELLREDGWLVNFKRVYRLWCREGLKIRKKQHKKLYSGTSDNSCDRKRPEYYSEKAECDSQK